jgi:hypothetical protein
MRIRFGIVLLSFLYASTVLADNGVTCYFTLAKDNCWTNYNVEVDVVDSANGQVIFTAEVPKGQQWSRATFPCRAAEKLMYIARFNPSFWQSDVGKTYTAQHYWFLPDKINPGDSAWNVSVCYSTDFALTPLPPEAHGACKCDFSGIPVIPPRVISQ